MDNRVFNVNGKTESQLLATLELLMTDEYGKTNTAKGWVLDKKLGFVIVSYGNEKEMNRFPAPLTAKALCPMVWQWLKSDEAQEIPKVDWERDLEDSDISVDPGFRVYCEDWGHVGSRYGCYGAVKPICCWYGK